MSQSVTIRPFSSVEDYRACVDLQEATWGAGFSERVSPAILKVSQILGGVAAGAYDETGALVGFVFGLTGVRDGETVHWSDMLAVRPEVRDGGLGRRLKMYQRDELLSRGITTMYWTFDPLQSRNAYLNLAKLGVLIREYRTNMYGESDSPLHRGIGTDRFVPVWLMDSERVRRRLDRDEASPVGDAPSALAARGDTTLRHPEPGLPDLDLLGNDAIRVAIPSDIGKLMADDMSLAVAWRDATRAVFVRYLDEGFEVTDFQRGGRVSAYLLTRGAEARS
ncbi:MAG: GNAT family N-acetyltransferase [Gemmatimonadetes bacterium]|nr:GNAT family N-acetyltransferase [Gemmatimonadota bacterium]NNF13846.1 GNAT family N-acetyltransferase [Gemmatimonadota bacterium]